MNPGMLLVEQQLALPNLKHFMVSNGVYGSTMTSPIHSAIFATMPNAQRSIERVYAFSTLKGCPGFRRHDEGSRLCLCVLEVEPLGRHLSSPPLDGPEVKFRFGRYLERTGGRRSSIHRCSAREPAKRKLPMPQISMIDESVLIQWCRNLCVTQASRRRGSSRSRSAGFIADWSAVDCELNLPMRGDAMAISCRDRPNNADTSLVLMAYADDPSGGAMKNPFAGELIELPGGKAVRGRGISEQKVR